MAAQSAAEVIGSRWMLAQILALLARIESDPVQTERLLQQADEYTTYIVDHSPPELHAQLLQSLHAQ